jgi:hypothetical protein
MTTQFYKRPAAGYTGEAGLPNRTKYYTDSTSSPKVPISSTKIDGDLNYLIDAVNELYDTAVTGVVGDNSITNAKLRDSVGCSVIGRSVNTTGNPADIVAATNDLVLVRDANVVQFGQVATAGIKDLAVTTAKVADTNITFAKIQNVATGVLLGRSASGSGSLEALTAGAGLLVNGSGVSALAARPSRQVFTSGSGTYTRPAGCVRINVRMVGAGGGGGGSGAGAGTGGTGGTTTFGSFTALGGAGGANTVAGNGGLGGSGGTGTASVRIGGSQGGAYYTASVFQTIGSGGSSPFGGAGQAPNIGTAALGGSARTNSGSGGAGACPGSNTAGGAGGGSGEYVEFEINSPTTSYSYAVGAAGTAGAGAQTGGAGGSGIIIVDEFYF